jgi:hypothetical protein
MARLTLRVGALATALLCGGALAAQAALWRRDRTRAERFLAEGQGATTVVPSGAPGSRAPKVTVLVAAWNEAGTLQRHLASVQALRYPHVEHVLCAGGQDGTYAIVSAHAAGAVRHPVRVAEQLPGEGKQRALRRAYTLATGDVVFLTDADCVLDDESFERTLGPILAGEEHVTSGGSRPAVEQAGGAFVFYQWAVQQFAAAHAGRYLEALFGRNAAVRRAALDAAGAFDADVPTGTDYQLGRALRRAGFAIRHVPHSLVQTRYPETLGAYARQQRRWLRNVAVLGARSGAWDEAARTLRTSAVGAGMLAGPLLALLTGGWLFPLWAAAFTYSAAAKVRYALFCRALVAPVSGSTSALGQQRAPIDATARLAPVVTLLEYGIWVLPLLDYLSPRRRRVW